MSIKGKGEVGDSHLVGSNVCNTGIVVERLDTRDVFTGLQQESSELITKRQRDTARGVNDVGLEKSICTVKKIASDLGWESSTSWVGYSECTRVGRTS